MSHNILTHCGWVHDAIWRQRSILVTVGFANGLSAVRRQATSWTSVDLFPTDTRRKNMLLLRQNDVASFWRNCGVINVPCARWVVNQTARIITYGIQKCSLKEINLAISSATCGSFCSGLLKVLVAWRLNSGADYTRLFWSGFCEM